MSISTVTSEALQAKLRELLPSQQGFGTDLTASDTILPIIDLTEAAEGSAVRQDLQSALSFGSQTSISFGGSTQTITNTVGFNRIVGNAYLGNAGDVTVQLNDGASVKEVFRFFTASGSTGDNYSIDVLVYLDTGDSVEVVSNATSAFTATVRQIADTNGNLINPAGFTPQ